MADLVMGAMSCLVPKLGELLKAEYNLQAGVKEQVRSLYLELEGAQAALRKVGQVPWDQLDEQVKLWSRDIREASYDMDDILDTFLVRVRGCDSTGEKGFLKRQVQKMSKLLTKSKARREISVAIHHIMRHVQEVTARRGRFKVDDIAARPATASTVDPRLAAMYTQVNKLVGIDNSSSGLMSMLRDDVSNCKMKTVSVFGPGGLGKTTLARAVYDKLIGDYDCGAFVSVGRTPDLKKVIQGILIKLNKQRYMHFNFALLHEISQFIDELREFLLEHKRYASALCFEIFNL
ncbi:unnamed protein product [Miscanthus lutarioriparius]|uniref:Uncharacterized protein n=1 Tax=Miscanthus lutarioriparius TaxID=422564 RepID=A0A811NP05_9POAL|nr:unnamed protein product [Miscanthus lutarioriparius]